MWLEGAATAVGAQPPLLFCLCCSDEDTGPSQNLLGVGRGHLLPCGTRLLDGTACGCGTGFEGLGWPRQQLDPVWDDLAPSWRAWVFVGGLHRQKIKQNTFNKAKEALLNSMTLQHLPCPLRSF